MRGYSWRMFLGDSVAGVTVALVALPLSIAIAIASGADPRAGLVTAIVGGFLISLLGGSRVQIGGPTGAFIVVVYGVIAEHGFDGLLLATMMAGVILVIGGLVRAGRFIALVPEPVIEGFTIGIALIIAVSQLKDLLGLSAVKVPADLVEALPALWAARGSVNPTALLLGTDSDCRHCLDAPAGAVTAWFAAGDRSGIGGGGDVRIAGRHHPVAIRRIARWIADAFSAPCQHCPDQRVVAVRFGDRVPGGRGVAPVCDRGGPHDR